MLQLERWRLVRLVPKKGALVTTVTGKERRDLLAVRSMFEIDAVQTLADGGDLTALAADLSTLLGEQTTALDAGDPLGFASADLHAFHARLIRSGDNAIVIEMLTTMGPRLARLTYQVAIEAPHTLDTLLTEHETLTDRAEAGDPTGFARLVRDHIESSHFPQSR